MSIRSNYPYLILTICWLVYCLNSVLRGILTPLLPFIEVDLGLTHAQTGFLASSLILGATIIQLPAGLLSRTIGVKRGILISVAWFSIMAFFTGLTTSYWLLAAALFILGLGIGMYPPSGISLLSGWFPEERRGRAFGIHESAPYFGYITGSLAVTFMAEETGWRLLFFIWVLPCLLVAFSFWRLVEEKKERRPEKANASSDSEIGFRDVLKNRALLVFLIPYTMHAICIRGMGFMIPLYLVNVHFIGASAAAAAYTASLIGGIVGPVVGGPLSDRIGRVKTLFIFLISLAAMILVFISLQFDYIVLFVMMCLVFLQSAYFPVNFALISDMVPIKMRAAATGLFMTVAIGLGGTLAPIIVGTIADALGFRIAFLFPALSALFGAMVILTRFR